MSQTLDVVLPVKDAVHWAVKAIEELFAQCGTEFRKLIIVDDGSTDESFARLQVAADRERRITLVKNAGRTGYGGACNFGASRSDASAIAFLNSDCLLTPGALGKMFGLALRDPSIGIICPLSNNSPVLTVPLAPGSDYRRMNRALEQALSDSPDRDVAIDACTVVGTCLMVTRAAWEITGGFSPIWGRGYGEETDLQFRAAESGFRGVVAINTYVYHYGGASFGTTADSEALRKKNHKLFFDTWGDAYATYANKCRERDPVKLAEAALARATDLPGPDVLFLIPGLNPTIGGLNVVVDICNHLVRRGVNATCAILGASREAQSSGNQALFFRPLIYRDTQSLIADHTVRPKTVVGTLYSTVAPAYLLSRRVGGRCVSFVQGHEFLFDQGKAWSDVQHAYELPDEALVTSTFLEGLVAEKTPSVPLTRLPLGIDANLFHPALRKPKAKATANSDAVCLGMVLRSAPDKGQPILLEVLDELRRSDLPVRFKVFSSGYYFDSTPSDERKGVDFILLPLSNAELAVQFRDVDIFVDASQHEGYGLLPLEAMASGATVVCSDSGGVRDFVSDGANGFVINEVNKPHKYVEKVRELVLDAPRLASFKAQALRQARELSQTDCLDGYAEYFEGGLVRPGKARPTVRAHLMGPVRLARRLSNSFVDLHAQKPRVINGPNLVAYWSSTFARAMQHEVFRPQFRFNLALLGVLERASLGKGALDVDWARQTLQPLVSCTQIQLVSHREGLGRATVQFSKKHSLKAVLPVASYLRREQIRWNQWALDALIAVAQGLPMPARLSGAAKPQVQKPWDARLQELSLKLFKHQKSFNACFESLLEMASNTAPPKKAKRRPEDKLKGNDSAPGVVEILTGNRRAGS